MLSVLALLFGLPIPFYKCSLIGERNSLKASRACAHSWGYPGIGPLCRGPLRPSWRCVAASMHGCFTLTGLPASRLAGLHCQGVAGLRLSSEPGFSSSPPALFRARTSVHLEASGFLFTGAGHGRVDLSETEVS